MTSDLSDNLIQIGDHVVQFYATDLQLVSKVGGYLKAAAQRGETLVVIAKSTHRRAFEKQLDAEVGQSPQSMSSLQCLLFDAEEMTAKFIDNGSIDRDGFHAVIGRIMRSALELGRPVHVYGEMVTVLWERDEVLAAIELETLWNELLGSLPFSLVCAYPLDCSTQFESDDALRHVCELHSSVYHPLSTDRVDAGYKRSEVSARFAAELDAPRAARHFVLDVLRQLDYCDELIDDAALVSTELATNAVVHANSPFSLVVVTDGPLVRISVSDVGSMWIDSDGLKAQRGHGLGLIDALASSWGVDSLGNGKVVWAQLDTSVSSEVNYALHSSQIDLRSQEAFGALRNRPFDDRKLLTLSNQ